MTRIYRRPLGPVFPTEGGRALFCACIQEPIGAQRFDFARHAEAHVMKLIWGM